MGVKVSVRVGVKVGVSVSIRVGVREGGEGERGQLESTQYQNERGVESRRGGKVTHQLSALSLWSITRLSSVYQKAETEAETEA